MSITSRTSAGVSSIASRSPDTSSAWDRSRSANVRTSGFGIGIFNSATGASSPASPESRPAAFFASPALGRVHDTDPSSWFQ